MPSSIRHKKTVSVTVDPALLARSRKANLNLSELLDEAIHKKLRTIEAEMWKAENHAAIKELNRITDENELLSDDHRSF